MLARGGREREIVNKDDHYSPHFQVGARRSPPGPATAAETCGGGGPFSRTGADTRGAHSGQPVPRGAPLREGLWLWILACS